MPNSSKNSHLSRREFLKLSAAALLATAAVQVMPAQAEDETPAVMWYGSRSSPYAALTYDDCYLANRMQDLLDILAGYPQVKVSLFPAGTALENNESKNAGIWKRFYEQGHEYGYHTFNHIGASVMSTQAINDDFDHWYETLSGVLSAKPVVKFYRPAYGIVSPSLLEMCQQRDLIPVMWSRGWGGKFEVSERAIRETMAGDIVLLHIRTDDVHNTAQGLEIHQDGILRFVTISTLYQIYLSDREKVRLHRRK